MPLPVVIVVDPYSSGAMLVEALRAREVPCVAVHSSPRIPELMRSRFDPSSFARVLQHDSDLEGTAAALSTHDPTHVVAGFESGVALADALSERLALPTNGSALTEARRDKYIMAQAVGRGGLAVPEQVLADDADEVISWIRESVDWPVILKPARSVASDNVHRCACPEEVRQATDRILGAPNVLGEPNEHVLAQEFLNGTEYVVDTVSCEGRNKVTAFWRYSRHQEAPGSVGYDAMTLLPYDGERQEALRAYVFDVLDVLGVRFGPAHSEVMWVDDRPVLVEVGTRLTASVNAVLSGVAGGISQLDETVEVILEPERFLATLDRRPRLERRAVNVFLAPPERGRLIRAPNLHPIVGLRTFHSMSVQTTPGEVLQRVAGRVTLVHADMEAIERDVAAIRELELRGLFPVEVARADTTGTEAPGS